MQNRWVAVLWMTGAILSFSGIAVCVRALSSSIHTFEMLAARSLIGLLILLPFVLRYEVLRGDRSLPLNVHLLRNSFHFLGQYGWFVGLTLLPLAEVFALEFTVPLWATLLATFFLGERFTTVKLVSLVIGLLGVLIIVRPGIEIVQPASFVVLGAAVAFAVTHVTTKFLSRTESALRVIFFMCLIQLPIGLAFAVPVWVWPGLYEWGVLVAMSVSALSAHFCMTSALRCATVSTVLTLDFLRLPFIAVVGLLLYNEALDFWVLFGGALMLLANWLNLGGSVPFKDREG